MVVDKNYCMSSYLRFRTIIDISKTFSKKYPLNIYDVPSNLTPIYNSHDLESFLKKRVKEICERSKVAICLSGGIDSAILAKFMPEGSTAYTFRCVVDGVKTIDETDAAKKYAAECKLKHKIIDIYWSDLQQYSPILMKHKGSPIHSIEVQIYKACLKAKEDGFDALIFGESADCNYGGFNRLLSKDWDINEFIDRYTFLNPFLVLRHPVDIVDPFLNFSNKKGIVDVHEFMRHIFLKESLNSYLNACSTAGITCFAPFSETFLASNLDLKKIRDGNNKYIVREVFSRLFPQFKQPEKIPMPRATNEWFNGWTCKKRDEFRDDIPFDKLTGDQKWQLYSLDTFLDMIKQE